MIAGAVCEMSDCTGIGWMILGGTVALVALVGLGAWLVWFAIASRRARVRPRGAATALLALLPAITLLTIVGSALLNPWLVPIGVAIPVAVGIAASRPIRRHRDDHRPRHEEAEASS